MDIGKLHKRTRRSMIDDAAGNEGVPGCDGRTTRRRCSLRGVTIHEDKGLLIAGSGGQQ